MTRGNVVPSVIAFAAERHRGGIKPGMVIGVKTPSRSDD
jgi:hypothetical protein